MKKYTLIFLAIFALITCTNAQADDPYLWLEEVDGKKALEFVEQQNKVTLDKLTHEKDYQSIYAKSLEIYNSTDRIAYPTIHGEFIYNFWQGKDHARGIWRRTSKADYLSGNATWETLLAIDSMAKKDSVKWVYKGANGLYPNYNRFLVNFSKGGAVAPITLEFIPSFNPLIVIDFYLP